MRKTSEVIARQIALELIDSGLPEGTMLANEQEMIDHFAVGRNTLREALRLLEAWGLVSIRTGRNGGPVVRHPQPRDLNTVLTMLLRFDGASIVDVFEARSALDPTMARLAADSVTEQQLAVLEDTVEQMLADPDDGERFRIENLRFNQTLAAACGNAAIRLILGALKSVTDTVIVAGMPYGPDRRKKVARNHARIIDALKLRDGLAAEQAMVAHMNDAREYWLGQREDELRAQAMPIL